MNVAAFSIEHDPDFGCELWIGRLNADGYPLTPDGRSAYRAVYEETHGPVPIGMELDHCCRRRRCVRHLEVVTRTENERRKRWAYRLKIKRCPAGHALTSFTAMITPEGGRVCRTCRDERSGVACS